MRAFSNRRIQIVAAAATLLLAVTASADTIATFADPAVNGSPPLFELIGDKLNGGWDDPGLTLIMPITSQVYVNATFDMTELTHDGGTGLSSGELTFYDQLDNQVLLIEFDQAAFYGPFGFGASDLFGMSVSMSGPGIPANLTEEAFAFSFANQKTVPGGFTWTASFTSSAIPEPSSVGLLLLGLLRFLRPRH